MPHELHDIDVADGADAWPHRDRFPMTQEGHDSYEESWYAWRRTKPTLAQVPMAAVEDHRRAVAVASANGWHE
jgi:hypothetical protein